MMLEDITYNVKKKVSTVLIVKINNFIFKRLDDLNFLSI